MESLTTGMGRTDAFAALFQERRLLAQLVRTGTEQECALRVGIDPFAKLSADGRYLRIPAGWSRSRSGTAWTTRYKLENC
jgi:hypothetical protein